jgi:hypothetical protein
VSIDLPAYLPACLTACLGLVDDDGGCGGSGGSIIRQESRQAGDRDIMAIVLLSGAEHLSHPVTDRHGLMMMASQSSTHRSHVQLTLPPQPSELEEAKIIIGKKKKKKEQGYSSRLSAADEMNVCLSHYSLQQTCNIHHHRILNLLVMGGGCCCCCCRCYRCGKQDRTSYV